MKILSSCPENTRVFDMEIAQKLGSADAAIIIQQLDYWMSKENVGVVIGNCKFIYNTFVEWVEKQFSWLSVWQFRMAMQILRKLGIVKVVRHRAKMWDQTNHYTLDYDRLYTFLEWKKSEVTEKVEVKVNPPEKQATVPKQEVTAVPEPQKQATPPKKQIAVAAASQKTVVEVEKIVNPKYKEHLQQLDTAGIRINSTIKKMVKNQEAEQVEAAIALFKTRKRESHIPNREGYFVQALKENWSSSAAIVSGDMDSADKGTVFRHWYDLARELGYCTAQKIKEGEQWVCMSGTWETWEAAYGRGYSMEYLKKILKRNRGQ